MRYFAVDLFCGAGGVSCGLIQAQYTVVAGIDIEKRCEPVYRQNKNVNSRAPAFLNFDLFPRTPDYPDGQQHLAIRELKRLLAEYKFSPQEGDRLLMAICAPCQAFSRITKPPLLDKTKEKHRRDKGLLLTTINIIEALKPWAVLCENVSGIDATFAAFKTRLEALDFNFDSRLINMADFGVPQRRKRTIGIAYNRRYTAIHPTVPTEDKKCQHVTVREAIGHLPRLAAGETHKTIAGHVARPLSDINLKRIMSSKPGGSNGELRNTTYGDLSLDCHRRACEKYSKHSFSSTYTRLDPGKSAPTITTKFLSFPSGRFGHFDTSQHRALSLKEGALLQTFPDDYQFPAEYGLVFLATLIGNAVPPKLAKFLGLHIKGGHECERI